MNNPGGDSISILDTKIHQKTSVPSVSENSVIVSEYELVAIKVVKYGSWMKII